MVRRWPVVVGGAAALLAGLGWAAQEPALEAYLAFQVGRTPSESELASAEACAPIAWLGAARLTVHDVNTPCAAVWLVDALVEPPGPREQAWMAYSVQDPALSSRARARIGLALWALQQPVPTMLPFWLTEPGVESERALAIDRLRTGQPASWADPLLWSLAADEPDPADMEPHALWARVTEARARPAASVERREALARATLGMLGLSPSVFEETSRRRAGNLPVDLPPGLALPIVNRGSACLERTSDACLVLLGELLRDLELEAEPDPPPEHTLPLALWHTLYADPEVIRERIEALEEVARWIGEAPEGAGERLLHSVAHSPSTLTSEQVAAGRVGDPTTALAHRMAPPWTAALAALTLGDLAGVPVEVYSVRDGVLLTAGGEVVGVGPCGVGLDLPPSEQRGQPWPVESVLASAALEVAGLTDGSMSARLRGLARRYDASLVPEPAASGDAERSYGEAVGWTILGWQTALPSGAEAERSVWGARWQETPDWGCPGIRLPATGTR